MRNKLKFNKKCFDLISGFNISEERFKFINKNIIEIFYKYLKGGSKTNQKPISRALVEFWNIEDLTDEEVCCGIFCFTRLMGEYGSFINPKNEVIVDDS